MTSRFAIFIALAASAATYSSYAVADDQPSQCFDVIVQTNPLAGTFLLNKCTGTTWILVRTPVAKGTESYRWYPLTVETHEAELPIVPPPSFVH